jgi:hypothetical protein
VLRDAAGVVADSLNYGLLADPWAAEGYQGASGVDEKGCFVPSPGSVYEYGPIAPGATADISAGRFPDGADSDSNCADFLVQHAAALLTPAVPGAANIKTDNVEGLAAGQTVTIGSGVTLETAVIAYVGAPGATTASAATGAGDTQIPVGGVAGFRAGQTVNIGSGANFETAVVASVRRAAPAGPGREARAAAIVVAAPLRFPHGSGTEVSGTGINLTAPLTRAHAVGAPVASGVPTPGAPNEYFKSSRTR